jgi:fluoride exporter
MIKNFLLVAAGGGIGAMLRYAIFILLQNNQFPTATLIINITGSFAIGIIMAMSLKSSPQLTEAGKLFLATGICGGFTTFSAFSYENIQLLQAGKYNLAFIYIFASVAAGLLAAWLGFKIFNA